MFSLSELPRQLRQSTSKCLTSVWLHNKSTHAVAAQAQVVIAGAGAVANSVAYHLIQSNWRDVLVLEQNTIGSGTSHFGSGTLGLFKPISHRNLIGYSINLYRQLQKEGHNIGLKQCGSVNLAQTKDRLISLKRRMAYNIPTGLHCELVTKNQLKDLHPYLRTDDLEGAVWVPEDAVADPRAICQVLAQLAQAGGAKYLENVAVLTVLTNNGRVCAVETSLGTVKCEYFVNCAGMWARELGMNCVPQVRIPAYPAEHFYATTGPLTKGKCNHTCIKHLYNLFLQDPNIQAKQLPCVRDFDSFSYSRTYNGGFLVGWFEKDAKPAFEQSQVPKDWKKYIKKDLQHFRKGYRLDRSRFSNIPL